MLEIIADRAPTGVNKCLFCIVFLCLWGCAQTPIAPMPGADFSISGRLAVLQGRKGQNLRFVWRQLPDRYDIEVWGALGQGRTRLVGNNANMRILRGDELLAAGDPQRIMLENLGWTLPLAVVPAWLGGSPALPATQMNEETEAVNASGQADTAPIRRTFSEYGWQVSLSRLEPGLTSGDWLPRKVVAKQHEAKLTVLIDQRLTP